jgi:SAM-dependent methyltransferase
LKAFVSYLLQWCKFKKLSRNSSKRFSLSWKNRFPCLNDNTETTSFDRHYVYHQAWAARILASNKPEFHVDISSMLFFCSLVSAFIPMKFFDYRPPDLVLDNLECGHADLLSLPFPDESISSLSCMHVIEHVGLGRYGDSLDPDGDLKAMSELKRVLAPGGNLFFVVPIGGVSKIMFNAHRIYSYQQVLDCFPGLELKEFALVPDDPADGGLIINATREMLDAQNYGCGCFLFAKT